MNFAACQLIFSLVVIITYFVCDRTPLASVFRKERRQLGLMLIMPAILVEFPNNIVQLMGFPQTGWMATVFYIIIVFMAIVGGTNFGFFLGTFGRSSYEIKSDIRLLHTAILIDEIPLDRTQLNLTDYFATQRFSKRTQNMACNYFKNHTTKVNGITEPCFTLEDRDGATFVAYTAAGTKQVVTYENEQRVADGKRQNSSQTT